MTSTPASRSARATTFAPRAWPSRPTFPTLTRILPMLLSVTGGIATAGEGAAGQDPQFTQGMPFFALTAPPCGPVLGMVTAVLGVEGDGVAVTSCRVALAPVRDSTAPAGHAG